MLFFPYATDAPVYHYPIATGAIISANILLFFATTAQAALGNIDYEQLDWLILEFNQINPLQWITNNFMHANFMHLFTNMCFLWAFGLVVEGKIGSVKFLGMYMAMGVLYGALVQIPMFVLSGESGALGASGVIFAVMMIALLWAPENDVECFYWFFLFTGTTEIKIVKLAGFFLTLQVFYLWMSGFSMSSEMLHMTGAMIGAPVGLIFLRHEWVDCEDWDLISRNDWLQDHPLLCSEKRRKRLQQKEFEHHDPVAAALELSTSENVSPSARLAARAGAAVQNPKSKQQYQAESRSTKGRGLFKSKESTLHQDRLKEAATRQTKAASHPEFNRLSLLLRQALQSGSVAIARQQFEKLDQLGIAIGLSDKTLFAYVKLLASAKHWTHAIRPLSLIVEHSGPAVADAQLKIATIQLNAMGDADKAMRTLNQIRSDPQSINDSQRKLLSMRDQLKASCNAKLAEKPDG